MAFQKKPSLSYLKLMKHDILHSIAHNFVDSYQNGNGFLIGIFGMDVHGEAAKSDDGYLAVDFLTGRVQGGTMSQSLSRATDLYREQLPEFLEKHGAAIADLTVFRAKFWVEGNLRHCSIEIGDGRGKVSERLYANNPLQRIKLA